MFVNIRTFSLILILSITYVNGMGYENGTCPGQRHNKCKPGTLLPLWTPVDNLSTWDKVARSIVYFVSLLYLFIGVSIIADKFMASIEVITSKEKEIIVKKKNGEKQIVSVRIWNETVSNLTLMALGSSAPEILLSVIEIIGNNFDAGDLGPGTIVGSAAFNLFVIIGICIIVIPNGQVRKIKHISVFFITASFSVFAYLWLYLIIAVISPKVIEVWEAVLTFAFFFITVICAYVADTKIFLKKFLRNKYSAGGRLKAMDNEADFNPEDVKFADGSNEDENLFDKHRLDYVEAIKEIRKRHPNIDTKQLEEMAQIEVLNKGPKSRAFYRMQATRQLIGSGNVIKKTKIEKIDDEEELIKEEEEELHIQKVFFSPGHYTVMENVGSFEVYVSRKHGDLRSKISVDYTTEDGTAVANEDYIPSKGTLVFAPGDIHQHFTISIIDDDVFEEDEHFSVRLFNLKVLSSMEPESNFKLVDPMSATIMVLDDDHSGVFHFEIGDISFPESCGFAEIKVIRSSGGRGVVRLPYQTISGTAKGGGKDFEDVSGLLEFNNDQTSATIRVRIIDDNDYEKNEFFYIQLGEPILIEKDESAQKRILHKLASHFHEGKKDHLAIEGTDAEEVIDTGKPRLGELTRIQVNIVESDEFKHTVDRLMKNGKMSLVVSTSSWKEQFIEAITVSAGGEEAEDDGEQMEEKLPSCLDYVMHFLTIFWKVMFAFVPPTDYLGGWLCFWVSMAVIGLLTAIIGDLASGFGCNIGLSDAVTALTFVALGTSLPDTFASKVAAIGDEYADGSVGNVTGSNAVNVFLGIGVAWSIAAIYHKVKGTQFIVEPGSLGFSVTIFIIFALVAILVIFLRRRPQIGGELGGPTGPKWASGLFLISLWMLYVTLSALENYCHIVGF